MQIDPYAVLGWLDSIDYMSNMNGTYGFYDAARSNSEIAYGYVGIDVASTVLGLKGKGGADFVGADFKPARVRFQANTAMNVFL